MIQLILKILFLTLVVLWKWNARAMLMNTIPDINKHAVISASTIITTLADHHQPNYDHEHQEIIIDESSGDHQCQHDAENKHDHFDHDHRRQHSVLHQQTIDLSVKSNYDTKKMPPALITAGNTIVSNNRLSDFNDVVRKKPNEKLSKFDNVASSAIEDTNQISDRDLWLNSTDSLMEQKQKQFYGRRFKRNIQQQNLCEVDCICKQENNFLTVECDFSQNRLYILGHTKYIPKKATSLIIKMSPNGQLRIDEYLFYQNNINKILIESQPHGKAHIEFGPRALSGNNGPFPEIDIVNCHTVVLRTNAFNGEYKLNITNCIEVMIFPEAFYNTTFHGHLENIADLHIFEKAFISNEQTKIEIVKCYIDQLNRLEASLKEIKFVYSTINTIKTGAFDVISIDSIIFEDCKIDTIEAKATTERLYSGYLSITGCSIGTVESDAIERSGIIKLLMQNNSIKSIEENAIHLTAVNAIISNNSINQLGRYWFRIQDWQNLTISNNKFGDFNRPLIDHTANPVQCSFRDNFITKANEQSLNFTTTHCQINDIFFMEPCTCNLDWLKKLTTIDIRAQSFCKIDNLLKPCFNTSLFNVLKYESDICDYTKTRLDCMKNKVVKKIDDNFIDPNDIKDNKAYMTFVYIIIGCIILLIIISVILAIVIKKIVKSRTITIPVSEMNAVTFNGSLKNSKSFSNDDRIIINQTLDNMRVKYPPEKYDQVYNNTKKLIEGNLTETEKVLTIGEIVRCLGECESTGEDFVAFTDILYKHLAPKDTNQNDPVYSEPVLSDTIEPDVYNTPDGQTNLDHIYAEPHSVQQPLLKNEYSAPVDKNEYQTNFYSEPIVNPLDKQRHIISPYAIGNNIDTFQSNSINNNINQPSTSRNLPDVINRSQAGMSSQEPSSSASFSSILFDGPSSSDFASNPKYHITRSPVTNRQIPKYTIPSVKTKLGKPGTSHSPDSLSSSNSEHSGGSDITCKIDDVIDYADA